MWFASPLRRRAAESYTRSDDGYRRYGHVSTVLTSTRGFEEWGRILGDEVMAVTLPDRLLHRCHIISIRGNCLPDAPPRGALEGDPSGGFPDKMANQLPGRPRSEATPAVGEPPRYPSLRSLRGPASQF